MDRFGAGVYIIENEDEHILLIFEQIATVIYGVII